MNLLELPDEILTAILRLGDVSIGKFVSRRARQLLIESSTNLKIHSSNLGMFGGIAERRIHLTFLEVPFLSVAMWVHLCAMCKELQTLKAKYGVEPCGEVSSVANPSLSSLSLCAPTDATLQPSNPYSSHHSWLLFACPNLKRLDCVLRATSATPLDATLAKLTSLSSLQITLVDGVCSPELQTSIVSLAPSLTELSFHQTSDRKDLFESFAPHLSSLTNLTSFTQAGMTSISSLPSITALYPRLKHLDTRVLTSSLGSPSNAKLVTHYMGGATEFFACVAAGARILTAVLMSRETKNPVKALHVHELTLVGGGSDLSLLEFFPNLTELQISSQITVDNEFTLALVTHCQFLTTIRLSKPVAATGESPIIPCNTVTKMILGGNFFDTISPYFPRGVHLGSDRFSSVELRKPVALQSFKRRRPIGFKEYSYLTNTPLGAASLYCLSISFREDAYSYGVEIFGSLSLCKQLRKLHLEGLQIGSKSLSGFLSSVSTLQSLSLVGSFKPQICDVIGKLGHKLRYLSLHSREVEPWHVLQIVDVLKAHFLARVVLHLYADDRLSTRMQDYFPTSISCMRKSGLLRFDILPPPQEDLASAGF